MNDKLIDLHCHTTASDGSLSSDELVRKASNIGLKAIAITDHDSISGMERALLAGEKYGVEIVPGIELSTLYNNVELHLLGYYINWKEKWFHKILAHFVDIRASRAKEMCKILREEGYKVSYKDVTELASGSIGKPHIATAVIRNRGNAQKLAKAFGKDPSISEFIVKYMVEDKIANVPKKRLDFVDGIKYIKKLGGVPVLAHPGYDLGCAKENIGLLNKFKKHGLAGIEVIYFIKDEKQAQESIDFYTKVAERLGLLITGGSDFHDAGTRLGMELGLLNTSYRVSYQVLEILKKELQKKMNLP